MRKPSRRTGAYRAFLNTIACSNSPASVRWIIDEDDDYSFHVTDCNNEIKLHGSLRYNEPDRGGYNARYKLAALRKAIDEMEAHLDEHYPLPSHEQASPEQDAQPLLKRRQQPVCEEINATPTDAHSSWCGTFASLQMNPAQIAAIEAKHNVQAFIAPPATLRPHDIQEYAPELINIIHR